MCERCDNKRWSVHWAFQLRWERLQQQACMRRDSSLLGFYHVFITAEPYQVDVRLRRAQPPCRNHLKTNGGSEWGSNPPATGSPPPAGFEDHLVCSDAYRKFSILLDS